MKPSFSSARDRLAGASPMMPYQHSAPRPSLQSSRPHRAATFGRWLATLPADLNTVREATLAALSEVPADLAYLYHADDKIVVRAVDGALQIRVEIMPVDAHGTRIAIVCTREGEADRILATRIMRAIETRLS